jgi:hypothetical protein
MQDLQLVQRKQQMMTPEMHAVVTHRPLGEATWPSIVHGHSTRTRGPTLGSHHHVEFQLPPEPSRIGSVINLHKRLAARGKQ